jgi:chemotaxis protein MotD
VLQSAQERLSASAAQPASTGGAGGAVQTPPEEVDATTPPAPARDLRSVVDAAAATQPASIAGQTTRIAQAVPPVLAQASGGRNRDERTASEQGADPGDSVPLLPRAGVAGAGNPIRSSSDRLAVAKPGSEQGGAGDRDAEPGTPAVPTERSALVSANEAPRTSTAVPPPTHQVAGQIVAAANAVQSEGAQPTATLGAKATVSSVVKVLHLELQPADMGTITIRMSLKQDGLDLRVVASRPETARLLQGDQDTLAKLLTSAGYRVEGMAVVAAPTDSAAVPDGRSQAFLPSSTPQQGNSSQSDSRPSGGRPNAEPDPRASRGNPNEDSTDKRRTVRRAGGDVYV